MFKKRAKKDHKIIQLKDDDEQGQCDIDRKNEGTQKSKQQQNRTGIRVAGQQQCDKQPYKKVKQEAVLVKPKDLMASSTASRKIETDQAVHKNFDSLAYSASIRDHLANVQQPDQLEEQIAKQKYLHNVEMTRQRKQGKIDPTVYRGMNSYANHAMTADDIKNAAQNFKKKQGPSRASSTIKNTCRFDYVQNLCKDWHDSGYCPFGNSCLYLHDRSNHKTGWELEKEYEKSEKERWKRISNPELALKEAQEASLKLIEKYKPAQECGLCKEPFEKPVEVECGHIFCMRCAIKLPKCQQCGKKLSGIMNNAEKFLSQQSEQYEEMKGKMQKESEMTLIRRQKYQNIDSLDVFAD